MKNIIRKMLSEDQMVKLSLEERLAAAHAVNDRAISLFSFSYERTKYEAWDNEKDDVGRPMAIPSKDAKFHETHPELLQMRISKCENNELQPEVKLTPIYYDFDEDEIGFVPLALGLNEVRDLICDPKLITRIVALTEFWPSSLINYSHEIQEYNINRYGVPNDDLIPF